jgi:transcriptional regulator with GAF, ATPase, and Fis domain
MNRKKPLPDDEDLTLPSDSDVVEVPRIEVRIERDADQPADSVTVIEGDQCRIGTNPSNELVLADRRVSRFHCCIRRGREAWRISDSGSLNGTTVNGVRVREADLPRGGCRLQLGDSALSVRELSPIAHVQVPIRPLFGSLVGGSLVMRQMFGLLDRVARSDSTVVVEGESGTGKELIASEIVKRGARARKPFVIVDCGSISSELIESELFGHAKGAFTGAERERHGAFEAADTGTVFLDEVGELPLSMQPKLLRVLEAHEIRRVGETRPRKVDVRVVAATNRQLEREVNQGRFREDLFFRLSVVTVRVPPLRDRPEDIPLLVDSILTNLGAAGRRDLFSDDLLQSLALYEWPGNVRELRNFIERSVVLDAVDHAPVSEAPACSDGRVAVSIDVPYKLARERLLADFERRYLAQLMRWSGGKVGKAAGKAGVDRMYLYRLMQRHGLKRDGFLVD